MSVEYSADVCRALAQRARECQLYRPARVARYDADAECEYEITPIVDHPGGSTYHARFLIQKFIGGGFAGQVYKARLIECNPSCPPSLELNAAYALKILIPPSHFSVWFRNALYAVGFQGPFQLQCNPAAARSGALWQKFIRKAAGIRFGQERAVNDVHATFVDTSLGSCGEISDWIDGRTWRLEVDDRMDLLSKWRKGRKVDAEQLGSPEYRAKKAFMAEFVRLLHEIGAHEFARQYEWSTWKSQPNCLKRNDTENEPSEGLVAVDFRAGLALLPFLPMSPGDIILILKGIGRASFVQFDRGSLKALERYVDAHSDAFADMRTMLDELKDCERIYRNSIPDITHNHIRLLFSKTLWSTMLQSAVTGWRIKNCIDDDTQNRLRKNPLATILFSLIGLLPFIGRFIRRIWGRPDWRRHYRKLVSSPRYIGRALQAKAAEKAIAWHRAGRLIAGQAMHVGRSTGLFMLHLPLSVLPSSLHKFFTNWEYAKERLDYFFLRPVRLYFNNAERERWLRDMVDEGRDKHIISEEDADVIVSQIKEPYIQRYLKSLAVHVCTLPVTQIVSVLIAIIYVLSHPEMPRTQAWGIGLGIIALFQVVPISPGSLTRGLYVVYLVIRERNFKDYNIAVFLGFFKYVGYLAFPIQMTYRYPALARFMAVHWATEAVHVVPVFGESGALLEHWIFCLFYNWPLTIRRRMRLRAQIRATLAPRYWHVGPFALLAALLFGGADYYYYIHFGALPTLPQIVWLAAIAPFICGAVVTLGCRGAPMQKRIVAAAIAGVALGGLATALSVAISEDLLSTADIIALCIWRIFLFTILSSMGAIVTEISLGEPKPISREIAKDSVGAAE
jgi:hypothetical protein